MYEVTQANYEKVMGKNPSWFAATGQGKDQVAGIDTTRHPVQMVSWDEAIEFCAKLSEQEKLKPSHFRSGERVTPSDGTSHTICPRRRNGEFSCRAGTTTKFWTGDRDEDLRQVGWFGTTSGGRTHAAGELKGNPFGLHDMHGNVCEWVQDWWDPNFFAEFSGIPALDPNGPSSGGSQPVFRGGDWSNTATLCRVSSRFAFDPRQRFYHIGFLGGAAITRCVA